MELALLEDVPLSLFFLAIIKLITDDKNVFYLITEDFGVEYSFNNID